MGVAWDERANWKRDPVTKLRLEKPFVDIRFHHHIRAVGKIKVLALQIAGHQSLENSFLPLYCDNQDKLGLQHQASLDIPLQNQFYHKPEVHYTDPEAEHLRCVICPLTATMSATTSHLFEKGQFKASTISHKISLLWERASLDSLSSHNRLQPGSRVRAIRVRVRVRAIICEHTGVFLV